MKKLLPLLVMLFLFQHTSFSQDQNKIDSLENELKKFEAHKKEMGGNMITMRDSVKANILNEIVQYYWQNNTEKAMDYIKECLALSEQIGYKPGIGNAYSNIGVINMNKSNYRQAEKYYQMALKEFNEVGYKKGIASTNNNWGILNSYQGNYPEALKNFLADLKISEEIGDKQFISYSYIAVGVIYEYLANYPAALKNFLAGLKISEELGDKVSNIG